MDKHTLVRYMYKVAKREVFNSKGRIVIDDFLKELPFSPKFSIIEMLEAWRELQPKTPIEWRMNCLIFDFGGKKWDQIQFETSFKEQIVEEKVVKK